VDAWAAELSHRTFAGWVAYASVEPFGEERADLRAGIIASVMANVSRDPKRRPQPFTPQEFMPFLHREPASDDANNLTLRLRAAFARLPRA
jgi:hypothetical protein